MKAKVVYYKNRFSDYIFARIMVPVAFSRNLIVRGSGKRCIRETLICSPLDLVY